MKKPINLVYGLDERPPKTVTLLTGLQHVGTMSIFLLFPLLVSREGGLSPEKVVDVLSISMLLQGVVTIVQAFPIGPVGAGYLCPTIFSAAYLGPSLTAVKAGGISLVYGMTVFAGLIECALSRLLPRFRAIFPPEIAGLVIVMIGLTNGAIGIRYALGIGTAQPVGPLELTVGLLSLASMVGLNVWAKGLPRVFCGLIGVVVGYIAAALLGSFTASDVQTLGEAPLVHLPSPGHLGWAFDGALAITFGITAVAAGVKAMGMVATYQKINDADWRRPEMGSIGGGVLADGAGTVIAGLLGTLGMNPSATSLGLASATGVTSRRIAYAIGGIFLGLAFLPKVAALLTIMPRPVIGAALLFTGAFVFVNGLEIITSRMLDARKTLVIGLSFMIGIAVDLYPGFFQRLSPAFQPFLGSSLAVVALCALVLNGLFRLGVRRAQRLGLDAGQLDPLKVEEFMEAQGASWGARREVIERASFNLTQSIETIMESCGLKGELEIEASFDEFNLDVRVSYAGAPLELPEERPTNEEIMASEEGQRKLAGFMLRRYADRVQSSHKAGRSSILFHFDH